MNAFVKLDVYDHAMCHPACLLLPEMDEKALNDLTIDIKVNGLNHPIIVDDAGMILDGRHRWQATKSLGIEPKLELFTGTEAQKIARVMSENVQRRHLTTAQRAAIAADLATLGRGGDRGNRYTGGKPSKGSFDTLLEEPAVTIAEAAKIMNVSEPSVKRARAVKAEDPAAHEATKRGERKKSGPIKRKREGTKIGVALDAVRARGSDGLSRAAVIEAGGLQGGAGLQRNIVSGEMAQSPDGTWFYAREFAPEGSLIVEPLKEQKLPPLPTTAQAKLDAYRARLDREFDGRVEAASHRKSQKWIEEMRIPSLEKRLSELEHMLSWPRNSVMTKLEYNAILRCLHPDSLNSRTPEQLAEAFRIFTKYKLKMINDEEEREEAMRKLHSNMPRTLQEMLARKKTRS